MTLHDPATRVYRLLGAPLILLGVALAAGPKPGLFGFGESDDPWTWLLAAALAAGGLLLCSLSQRVVLGTDGMRRQLVCLSTVLHTRKLECADMACDLQDRRLMVQCDGQPWLVLYPDRGTDLEQASGWFGQQGHGRL